MDLFGALLDEVILEVFDEEWVQTLDYEHIPFRSRKCHEHGNLFRECPLNKTENGSKVTVGKDTESFHKVGNRGRGGKRLQKKNHTEGQQASPNRYKVLEEEEEVTKVDQVMEGSPGEKEKEENREKIHDNNQQNETMLSNIELEMDQEMTPSEVEMEDHELQDILEREHLDLERFLKQGTMEVWIHYLKRSLIECNYYFYGTVTVPEKELNPQLFRFRVRKRGINNAYVACPKYVDACHEARKARMITKRHASDLDPPTCITYLGR